MTCQHSLETRSLGGSQGNGRPARDDSALEQMHKHGWRGEISVRRIARFC